MNDFFFFLFHLDTPLWSMSLMKYDTPEPLPPPSLLFKNSPLNIFPLFLTKIIHLCRVKSLMKPDTLDGT